MMLSRSAIAALFLSFLCSQLLRGQPARGQSIAQSITPTPDGTGTIVEYNGNTYTIQGGTQAGANLFHSFQEFGLSPQEIADFLSNPSIENILGRVTGGNPSIIEGLIRVSGGNSNLFLMNEAGWIFTENATIDIPGSFAVTTANRIGFTNGFFNATGENNYTTLTGNPTHFIFDSPQPGGIINAGNLSVAEGENLWIIGGSVVNTGTFSAPNGNITVAAIPGQQQVRISHDAIITHLILDAAPAANGENINSGLNVVDLARYISGESNITHATGVQVDENGRVVLFDSQTPVGEKDVTIAGEISARNVTLISGDRVNFLPNSATNSIPWVRTGDGTQSAPTVILTGQELPDSFAYIFIDTTIENYQDLLYGGNSGTIAIGITREENGIEAIDRHLGAIANEGQTIEEIHIITEGNEGEFWLGNAFIDRDNIEQYRQQLQSWRESLSETADILLYSCFTALGEAGEAFINTLATTTGADVAASTNLTGNAALGGDWELEYQTGNIEAATPLQEEILTNYDGKLAVFTVGNATDLINFMGSGITEANGNGTDDTIRFSNSITLTAIDNTIDGANGLPSIIETGTILTIDGMGNTLQRDAAAPDFRIFHVANNTTLNLENITVSNGRATSGVLNGQYGGAIFNQGTIHIDNSTIANNEALRRGGGIYNDNGTINIDNSTIARNTADTGLNRHGGGIHTNDGTVMLENSTISGNTAGRYGGGIYAGGGAILTIENSTITDNNAMANNGGGIYSYSGTTTSSISNSIIAGNAAGIDGQDVYNGGGSTFNDLGNNLIGISDGSTGFTTSTLVGNAGSPIDPMLGPLQNNGGATETHALLAGSPAINAGNNTLAPTPRQSADQRGYIDGIVDGTVDIGSYEFGATVPPVSPNPTVSPSPISNVSNSIANGQNSTSTIATSTFSPDLEQIAEENRNIIYEIEQDINLLTGACPSIPEIEWPEIDWENEKESEERDRAAFSPYNLDERSQPILP